MYSIETISVPVVPFHLGDCSNNGISKGQSTLQLITNFHFEEHFDEAKNAEQNAFLAELRKQVEDPRMLIYVKRILWGQRHDYLKPLFAPGGEKVIGPMFGGNKAVVDGIEVKIHDRYETAEEYEVLSR